VHIYGCVCRYRCIHGAVDIDVYMVHTNGKEMVLLLMIKHMCLHVCIYIDIHMYIQIHAWYGVHQWWQHGVVVDVAHVFTCMYIHRYIYVHTDIYMVYTNCGGKVLLLMQHIWVLVRADTIRGNIRHEGKLMCCRLHIQGNKKSKHIHSEYASETTHLTHLFTN